MYGRAWQRLLIQTGSGATLLLLSSCGPIIKNIWSPAFVLAAAGWGSLLLAFFHLICDLLPHRKWWIPFAVVGQNALFIYLITHIIDFKALTLRIFGGVIAQLVPANLHGAAISTGFTVLVAMHLYVPAPDIHPPVTTQHLQAEGEEDSPELCTV